VFLDRLGRGTAPLTITDIAPGPHRLNVSAPGYDGYAETLDLAAGERVVSVAFKPIRLDARLAVEHKHGIGSGRGTLVASPQGIRFDGAEGGDSFTLSFADVETFEVEYLARSLRLKVQRGRTCNCADPDDDADRLFVFHRDVDKVRARVVAGE
jgi:hypothetical protein